MGGVMEEIKEKFETIKERWGTIYEKCTQNPSQCQQYLPNITVDEIDVMVSTLEQWLSRVRVPAGNRQSFRVVKGFFLISLNNLATTTQNLVTNQFQQLPSFVNQLIPLFSALHTMMVLGRGEAASVVADLSSDLAEAYALVVQSTSNLDERIKLCESAEDWKEKAEQASIQAETFKDEIEELKTQCITSKKQIDALVSEISENKVATDEFSSEFEELLSSNQKLQKELDAKLVTLNELIRQNEEQKKIIDGLLPNAASAGLAHSFEKRRSELNNGKFFWCIAFFLCIAGIMLIAWLYKPELPTNLQNAQNQASLSFLLLLLYKLPFIGPLVWAGVYSAIQYGYTIRLQEDYSFKKTTAEAFIGYRDHMDHLKKVSDAEGNTALQRLSTSTVDVLSNEPLRVYEKRVSKEAMPIADLMEKQIGLIAKLKALFK